MVDGFANFTDLYINEVGVDYTLVFTASNLWVESDPFNVTLGPPVKVAIKTQPGTATGGLPLLPQPVVELQVPLPPPPPARPRLPLLVLACLPLPALCCDDEQ